MHQVPTGAEPEGVFVSEDVLNDFDLSIDFDLLTGALSHDYEKQAAFDFGDLKFFVLMPHDPPWLVSKR